MKNIYFMLSMVVLTLFTACENFNEKNFPGYDEAAKPTNLVTYNYTLTDADYGTISKAALKIATTKEDSAVAKAVATNKYLLDSTSVSDFIPLLLATKYAYADTKSTAIITFNKIVPFDTTKIATANKYSLVAEDYIAMGTASGQPGQYKNFSSSIDPAFYIPIWLKLKYPFAKSGDIRMIRYLFFVSSTSSYNVNGILTYDGINWVMYKTAVPEKAKFVFKNKLWQFIDSDIYIGLNDGIGDFTTVNVSGDQVWAWNSYKYMMMTGYVSPAYFSNEDWLISPSINLTERATPWLTFMHVGRYFGDSGSSTEKMRKAITLWVSTTSDGKTIKTEDWKQLTIPEAGYPSGASWTLISSTPIDLKAYAGKNNVRIAFRYLSDSADKAAGTWEVKNFYIYEE